MASVNNLFNVLSINDNYSDEDLTDYPVIEKIYTETKVKEVSMPALSKFKPMEWGDLNDSDNEIFDIVPPTSIHTSNFLPINKPVSKTESIENTEVKSAMKKPLSKEEKKKIKELDLMLSKKREISIDHNIRVYDKENDEVRTEVNTRIFQVTSQNIYDSILKLILGYRTHKNGKINYKQQADKIKLTNQLMNMCYKDSKVPYCFVYPIIIINIYRLNDNDDENTHKEKKKTLTRNYIKPGSKCQFTVSSLNHFFELPTSLNGKVKTEVNSE
jgi:hypothetical protein